MVLIGTKKTLAIAIRSNKPQMRYAHVTERLQFDRWTFARNSSGDLCSLRTRRFQNASEVLLAQSLNLCENLLPEYASGKELQA
jgi:hypothetical protein